MQLDRVRRDAGLSVLEIKKEGHADDRVATEGPQRTTHASLPLEVVESPRLSSLGYFARPRRISLTRVDLAQ
jgi:hypothetical protein